jgi:hypothetical protein
MQSVAGQDVGREGVDQRLQRRRGGADPAAQGRGLQAHPVAGEDLGLTIERQMIVVLRDNNMSQQPRAGPAAGNRVVWRRRRDHGVASPARQFLANVPDDFEPARHVIEDLADFVDDLAQRAAATGAGAWCRMAPILSRQVFREWATRWLLRAAAVSAAAATSGEAAANRSAWSVCSASSASSSCSASRASFSEDCPNSARRYRANWNFSRAISAWAVSASCAIVAMMRFSAARPSGRLSVVIGTPAVDQTGSRFGQ